MSKDLIADFGLGHIRIEEAHIQSVPSHSAVYGSAEGFHLLRQQIAIWENIPVKEVTLTTGASLGIVATLATLERPCSILCPRPYYPAYPKIANILGIEVIYYDLEKNLGWKPDPEKIAQLIREDTRALLLNFPNNPTGSMPNNELLQEIALVISRSNLLVISDEVYADLIYDATPFPDMRAVFGYTSVVRLKSFSKRFGLPGERLGYAVAEPNRLQAICRAHWALAMSPPASAQAIALKVIQDSERRVHMLCEVLARNRETATQLLSSCKRIKSDIPQAGIFNWIEIPDCQFDSFTLAQALIAKAKVVVMPGATFGVDYPIYIRVSFGVPREEIIRGLEALIYFLEHL